MPTAEAVQRWERETITTEKWPTQTCADQELEAEIKHAAAILKLTDNWDGEGSPGYKADTLKRAVWFLTSHAERLCSKYGVRLPVPKIGPGPNGSIDIHWKSPWELLINIPADPNEMASFYGDNYGSQKIRGSFDLKTFNLGPFTWLMH